MRNSQFAGNSSGDGCEQHGVTGQILVLSALRYCYLLFLGVCPMSGMDKARENMPKGSGRSPRRSRFPGAASVI